MYNPQYINDMIMQKKTRYGRATNSSACCGTSGVVAIGVVPKKQKTMPTIKRLIFNPPATIIIWQDGTKTVCKTNEDFDPEVGVAMCIAKKYYGSRHQMKKKVATAFRETMERDALKGKVK